MSTQHYALGFKANHHVDYVWDRDNCGENRELQLIQNKALGVVYNVKLGKNPHFNTELLHEESNYLKLDVRRDMHLLFYAFSLPRVRIIQITGMLQ